MDEDDIVDDTPFGGEDHIDTEEDIKRRKDERAAVLGFYPQKEIIYNSLLPYSDRMDEESNRLWQEIKTNLGRAICLHELRPGYVIWSGRLIKYILHFSYKSGAGVVWISRKSGCSYYSSAIIFLLA